MPASAPTEHRICPACDGFPVVHISIGPRTPEGTLPTLAVVCLHCHGTGHTTVTGRTPALAPAGR